MRFNFKRKKFTHFLEQKGFVIKDDNFAESFGDIVRGIGGFIGGVKRGLQAGEGTSDMQDAEHLLENQLTIAFENFVKNLVRAQDASITPEQQNNIRKFLVHNIPHLLNNSLNYKIMKKAYAVLDRGNKKISSYIDLS